MSPQEVFETVDS